MSHLNLHFHTVDDLTRYHKKHMSLKFTEQLPSTRSSPQKKKSVEEKLHSRVHRSRDVETSSGSIETMNQVLENLNNTQIITIIITTTVIVSITVCVYSCPLANIYVKPGHIVPCI